MPTAPLSADESAAMEPAGAGVLHPADSSAEPAAPVQETTAASAKAASSQTGVDITALERELAAVKDRHLRLLADFENARKRQTREREDTIRRANEELLHALLPVLDHLELALATPTPDPESAFVKGVRMVAEQFVAVLQKFDLKPITAVGHKFDPEQHEALTQMPVVGVPSGHVAQQLRRGWNLSGRLLRPAQVIVSSGAPEPENSPEESEGGPVSRPL